MTAARIAHLRSVWKRRFAKYSRWLHIYVSMASFAIVFFFALTGITLNHAEWFSGEERATQVQGHMEATLTQPGAPNVDKLAVIEYLRTTHGIGGAVSDFRVEDGDLSIAFKGPGYAADVLVDRASGRYELTESRLGFVAIINDLHKGRDTGAAWKGLIDVSAGVLTFISLTGLMLLYFIHKHRLAGALLLVIGGAATYIMYLAFVP
jgi:uncharacterized protein